MAHRHAAASPPRARTDRTRAGAALAAVPHVLILVVMCVEVLRTDGDDRAYAALVGVGEIYVVPAGLVAGLVLRLSRRGRAWSAGVVVSTLVGAVVVVVATLVVGSGATWS